MKSRRTSTPSCAVVAALHRWNYEAMASDGREFGEERLLGTATSLSVEPLGDLQRLPERRHPIESNSEPALTSRQHPRFCDFNHNRVWRRSWLDSSLDLKLNSCVQRRPP